MAGTSTPSVDAATGNATQAANQTGEKMQSGMANVTQESKSAANQTTSYAIQGINLRETVGL